MVGFRCHGCGAQVDAGLALAFRCPNADGNDVDHVLVVDNEAPSPSIGSETDPFLRYRAWLSPYRLAREAGLPDTAWADLVGQLDNALTTVDGHGFRVTPMADRPALAEAFGLSGALFVKDETGNVSGSHKARHLMGVMLYLRVLETARLPAGDNIRSRRLAIASCGNAALAAAVVARAANWPLDVFIPPDADMSVKARLRELGAQITICDRRPGETGDPCYLRFREAVAAGAIPFGVQGTDNGLAIEGGRTLAFEMAEEFHRIGTIPDALFVQVGGGALASALAQGLALARANGLLPKLPKLITVQTAGCAPLARAWERLDGIDLATAAKTRSKFMWPWETTPSSLAHGILDDETYDWWAIAEGMRASGGSTVVVDEAQVAAAHRAGRTHTDIVASATGTAGLAGAIAKPEAGKQIAVIFSGVER
ncbi:PLP-dependent lyase/thiolase [Pleomorphomonas sp. NRK KF1]|uniref:PLP-dependent lyase/thiolase n=1 Tax=Pleomorphomonas sp. NRK KF1 TaxID=2943000 RepID=UPI0020433C48|nr:PLP-dependent lyase/thiolase [Pleomorphomonas sp. NRK KF1]MCM5553173.1 PLP-dependent lyase/thiolase [Pleomorphomonas sp. NRK KF1]